MHICNPIPTMNQFRGQGLQGLFYLGVSACILGLQQLQRLGVVGVRLQGLQGLGFSGIESPNMVRNSTMPWDYSGFRVQGLGFTVLGLGSGSAFRACFGVQASLLGCRTFGALNVKSSQQQSLKSRAMQRKRRYFESISNDSSPKLGGQFPISLP